MRRNEHRWQNLWRPATRKTTGNDARSSKDCMAMTARILTFVLPLLLAAIPAAAQLSIPPGAKLHVRLLGPVSSNQSRPGDRIEAVLIAPVRVGEATLLEAGYRLHATVKSVRPSMHDTPA